MKKSLIAILTCMMGLQALAETRHCVVIHETQGQTAFSLEQKPVVSFTDTHVKLVCGDVEVLYSLDHYLKMTIEETDLSTSMEIVADRGFSISGHTITAHGCSSMALYTIDGKIIANVEADADGVANISIEQLKEGVYIAKIGGNAFKIYKR